MDAKMISVICVLLILGTLGIAMGSIGIQCKNDNKMSKQNYEFLVVMLVCAILMTLIGSMLAGVAGMSMKKQMTKR